VVGVKVRGHQVIDLGHPGIAHRGHDPVGVPGRGRPAVGGVDEQRFARGRHQQRGVSAFDVDQVEVERGARTRLRRHERHGQSHGQSHDSCH
jgi:hypothetical protein